MKNELRVYRAKQNISQEVLAKGVSVSRQTIYAIESGKYVPSTILALKLAEYFKTSVEQLFVLEETD